MSDKLDVSDAYAEEHLIELETNKSREYGQIMDIMSDDTRQLFAKGADLFMKGIKCTQSYGLTEDEIETAIRFGTLIKVLSLGENDK